MSFRQGRFSEITVSGVNISAYCDSIELSRDAELLETTTFTKTSKTYLTGLQDGKVDIAGKYDPATPNGPNVLLNSLLGASNSVPIQVMPGGNTSGQLKRYFDGFLVSFSESSEVGGVVAFKGSFQIDGPVMASGL